MRRMPSFMVSIPKFITNPRRRFRIFKTREQLAREHRIERPGSLHFYNQSVVDDKIRPKGTSNTVPSKLERDRLLTFDTQAQSHQITRQHHLVNGLQQSRPQFLMYADARTDYDLADEVELIHLPSPVLSVSLCEN